MSTLTTSTLSQLDTLETVFESPIARLVCFLSQLHYDAKTKKYLWQREADGLIDFGLINAMSYVGIPVPLVGGYEIPNADGLPEKLFNADPAGVTATIMNAAAARLGQTGDLAWKLLEALNHAVPGTSPLTVSVSSNALRYLLAAADSSLADSIPADLSSLTVSREVLAQMALDLRRGIPGALSALFEAQLAALPSGNGLQLVDMSGWLGSALYNADGSATGLSNILKLEGFDPSVKPAMSSQDFQTLNTWLSKFSTLVNDPTAIKDKYGRIMVCRYIDSFNPNGNGLDDLAQWRQIQTLLSPLMDVSLSAPVYSYYYDQQAVGDVCYIRHAKSIDSTDGVYVKPELLQKMAQVNGSNAAVLTRFSGDLMRSAGTGVTEATAETIQSWAAELARGGSHTHGADAAAPIAVVTSPVPVSAMTSAARSELDKSIVAVQTGFADLKALSQKSATKATIADVAGSWIDTGVSTLAGKSDAFFTEIESVTQTRRADWKMVADSATQTYKILDTEAEALFDVAALRRTVLQSTASIDDLVIRRSAALTFANHAGWIKIADDEASGLLLLQKLKSADASIAVYDPIQESDLGKAKLGVVGAPTLANAAANFTAAKSVRLVVRR